MASSGTKTNLDENGPNKKMDVIGSLPVEISQRVFLILTLQDIRSALRCNTKWINRMRGDYFWKEKCKIVGFGERKEFLSSEFYNKFIEMYSNYWQSVYMYNAALSDNWEKKNYEESILQYKNFTETFYYADDEFVIIGKEDPPRILLYSYELKMFTKVFPVNALNEEVKIIRSQNYLIYTDRKKHLYVWDIAKGIMVRSFIVFDDRHIVDINVYKNLLGVIFGRGFFKIFNLESWKTESTTPDPSARFQYFPNERVAYASIAQSIRLVNLQDKSVTDIECCENMQYHEIKLLDDHLIGLCGQSVEPFIRNFCVWKIGTSSHKLIHRIKNFQHKYKSFYARKVNRVLFLTNSTTKMEVWDFSRTGIHLFTINCRSNIWSVCLNDYCVIVCTKSLISIRRLNVFNVWCIETGTKTGFLSVRINVCFAKATNTKLVIFETCMRTRDNYLRIYDFEKFDKIK